MTMKLKLSTANRLPLDTIMIVTSELYPKIQELQSSLSGPTANTAIVDLLRNASLEQHLPHPGPPSPRRFIVSDRLAWVRDMELLTTLVTMLPFSVDRRIDNLANVSDLG